MYPSVSGVMEYHSVLLCYMLPVNPPGESNPDLHAIICNCQFLSLYSANLYLGGGYEII